MFISENRCYKQPTFYRKKPCLVEWRTLFRVNVKVRERHKTNKKTSQFRHKYLKNKHLLMLSAKQIDIYSVLQKFSQPFNFF